MTSKGDMVYSLLKFVRYNISATAIQGRKWPGSWQRGCVAPPIESKVKNWETRRKRSSITRILLPPVAGRRLLYHMDVEGGVDHLGQLEEVGIGGVGRRASKDSLKENIL